MTRPDATPRSIPAQDVPEAGWVVAVAAVAAGIVAGTVALGARGVLAEAWWPVVLAALVAGGAAAAACRRVRRRAQRQAETAAALRAQIDALCVAGGLAADTFADAPAEQRLARIGRRLSLLSQVVEGVNGVEALFDAEGRLLWIGPSVTRVTGFAPAACIAAGDMVDLLVHESDRRYCRRMMRQVLETGEGEDFELRLLHSDGRFTWVASHWRAVDLDDGERRLRMSAEDIQARKETEYKLLETVAELRRAQALREHYLARSNDERQRLSALLNVIRLGILFIDRDHRVLYCNRATLEIWGFPPDENLLGVREAVLQQAVAGRLEAPEVYFEHVRRVVRQGAVSAPYEIRFTDGRILTDVSAVVEGAPGERSIGRVWIYEDVTEQRRAAAQLTALAERDPLTNLYNRRRFHEELARMLAEAARREVEIGLVAFDLDGFKPINDEFGHQAGDEVLVGLADGVRRIIRRNEMLFRLGGDEFAVLVPDTNAHELEELASRLVEGVAALEFRFGGRAVGVTASIGIALYPHHACDGETLIAAADSAMYRAKSGGRNRWTVAASLSGESARMAVRDFDEPDSKED